MDKNHFTNIFTALEYYGISPDTKLKKVSQKNLSYFLISHQRYGITTSFDICKMPENNNKQIYKSLIEHHISLLIFNLISANAVPQFIFTTLSFSDKMSEDSVSAIFGIINKIAGNTGLIQVGGFFRKNQKKDISLNLYGYGETAGNFFLKNSNPVSDSTLYYTGNMRLVDSDIKTSDSNNFSDLPANCLLNRLEIQELNDLIFKNYTPYYTAPAGYSLTKVIKDIIQSGNSCELALDNISSGINDSGANDKEIIRYLFNCKSNCGLFFISTKKLDQKFYNSIPISPIGSITELKTKSPIKIRFRNTLLTASTLEDITK